VQIIFHRVQHIGFDNVAHIVPPKLRTPEAARMPEPVTLFHRGH
jgi:hypothetical protein